MIDFNKYAQEGNAFLNELSAKLGHANDKAQVGILLRAVLHTLRDMLQVGESLNLLSQLPMFLKAIYVENWKHSGNVLKVRSLDEFTRRIEIEQANFGERRFNWNESTFEITRKICFCLKKYISEGEVHDIVNNLPHDIKLIFSFDLVEQ